MKKLYDLEVSDISETLLFTLYSHAMESISNDPIIYDPKDVEITDKLNQELLLSKRQYFR